MAFYKEAIVFKKAHKKKTNIKTNDKFLRKRGEKKKGVYQSEIVSSEEPVT